MQSFSSKEEEKLPQAHEYLGDTLYFRYNDCISCGTRTGLTCIKCGFCHSCHWKKEQVEEIELRDNLKDFYASLSKAGVDEDDNDKSKLQDETRKGHEENQPTDKLKRWLRKLTANVSSLYGL
jgi:hypothetical protein